MNKPRSYLDIVPQQWAAILEAYEILVPRDAYLHWDELARQPEPDGISHEAWWAALKMERSARLHQIPLKDESERSFSFSLPDGLCGLLHQIDHDPVDALVAPVLAERSVAAAIREEAIASAALAGVALLHDEAREMLRSGREPHGAAEQAVVDLHRALELVDGTRDDPLSPHLLMRLNRCITGLMTDGQGGVQQPHENIQRMDLASPRPGESSPADQMSRRLESICAFANAQTPGFFVHPLVRAIILHFWLIHERPFAGGNKRTARALFRWAMLRQGYPLFRFVSVSPVLLRDPERYHLAIEHVETDDNDLTYFILHQSGAISEALVALREKAVRQVSELRETGAKLKGFAVLNPRQKAVMIHALHRPEARYGIAGHQHSHGVTHQTARDDLFDLVRRELLLVGKEGRSFVFKAPADLARRLHMGGVVRRSPTVAPSDELPTNLR